ncbi:MAG: AAA family ATPase [Nitrososphaerota archaeon]
MQNASKFLEFYYSRNLTILPLEKAGKAAVVSDWPNRSREDLFKHFKYLSEFNIGLRLDGLIALDIEKPEIYDAIFKQPVEVFARVTWIQRTGGGGYHILFRGHAKPIKINGLVELRSGNGQYIVVAPSIHPETKKPYQWISDIEKTPIAEISDQDLERLRRKLEILKRFAKFIEAMTECWKRYHRHFLSLWCSGVFRKMGLPFEDAEIVLRSIVKLAGDEEVEDRLRCLRDTYQKPMNEIKAWSGLKDELLSITGSEEETHSILKSIPIQKGLLFEVKSLKELIEGAKDIDYISYPLIPHRSLIVLAGRGGVGKSLISLHIAHCVANGNRIFDYYDSKQCKVLIIDNENNASILKQRSEILDLNPIDTVDVINFTEWRLDKKDAIAKLKNLILSNGYGLLILDNWTVLTSIVEENKATEVSNILTKLRKTAYETNSTILLIHHLRKGMAYATHDLDELRGSSVIVNEADVVYILEKDNITGLRIMKTVKNRLNDDSLNILLKFEVDEDETLKILYKGELEKAETDVKLLEVAKLIRDFMQKKRKASRKEIVEALKGYSEATVKRALTYLLTLGVLERPLKGTYQIVGSLDSTLEENF